MNHSVMDISVFQKCVRSSMKEAVNFPL